MKNFNDYIKSIKDGNDLSVNESEDAFDQILLQKAEDNEIIDFLTSLSGAATSLANVGPGLGNVIGPSKTFAGLTDTTKWILITGMLTGRLELLSVIILLTPSFWKN